MARQHENFKIIHLNIKVILRFIRHPDLLLDTCIHSSSLSSTSTNFTTASTPTCAAPCVVLSLQPNKYSPVQSSCDKNRDTIQSVAGNKYHSLTQSFSSITLVFPPTTSSRLIRDSQPLNAWLVSTNFVFETQ